MSSAMETAAWTPTPAELLTARLDRLPMTRTIWTMAALVSLGGFFDALALELTATLAPGLFHAKIITPTTPGLFGTTGLAGFIAALFAGMFVGTILFSYVADLFGRRSIFAISLLWYGTASFVMAFQSTAFGLNLWRFIATVGLGVELVTVDAYLSELVPKMARGKAFAFLLAISAIAGPFAYFLAWQLVPIAPFGIDGWRWVVGVSSLAAIVVWIVRLGLPESPRWLAHRGRIEEAERVTARIEERVAAEYGRPLPRPERPLRHNPRKGSLAEIFNREYRSRTVMLMLFNFFQTVGFYGFFAWVPTLLIAKGIHVTQSLEYGLIIKVAGFAWPFINMLFADRIERKWQVCGSCFAIAVFGILFGIQTTPFALIVLGTLLSMSTGWLAYSLHNYQAELYPTRIRARAVGFVYSWSRLSGILVGFMVGFFLRQFGVPGVFVFVAACMLVVIVTVAAIGPRTKGLELEAIAY
ncbi:MAG: MFS transporter [Alphaproteobacteria bacterium]|nr:MFS transporter [Alphaproteobacteria bacterium]